MVELKRNPGGEVQLTTVPNAAKLSLECSSTVSPEDSAKIAELRNTIASLKADIEKVK